MGWYMSQALVTPSPRHMLIHSDRCGWAGEDAMQDIYYVPLMRCYSSDIDNEGRLIANKAICNEGQVKTVADHM